MAGVGCVMLGGLVGWELVVVGRCRFASDGSRWVGESPRTANGGVAMLVVAGGYGLVWWWLVVWWRLRSCG